MPPPLDALILRLLAKDPRHRVGHADLVAAVLAECGAGDGGAPAPLPRPYLYRPRLVGRGSPLRTLVGRLDGLAPGTGGLLLVGGESGVGKTRLLMEFGGEAARRHALVLDGACPPDQVQPLAAFRRPLQLIADHCRGLGGAATDRVLGRRGRLLALYEPALRDLPGQDRYPDPEAAAPAACRCYLAAARQAVDRSAPGEAERLYRGYFALLDAPSAEGVDQARPTYAGAVLYLTARAPEAIRENRRALEEARLLGRDSAEARAWYETGQIRMLGGTYDAAERSLRTALRIYERAGDRLGGGQVLSALGAVASQRGRPDEARALLAEALAVQRSARHGERLAVSLVNLGNLEIAQGEPEAAYRHYAEALELHRQAGNRRGEGVCLSNMAVVEQSRLLAQAMALARAVGDSLHLGFALCEAGHQRLARGGSAEEDLAAALEVAAGLRAQPTSELGVYIERLRRAQKVFESGGELAWGDTLRTSSNSRSP